MPPVTLVFSADGEEYPKSLNLVAVAGLVVAGLVAMAGLFALPTLASMGMSFREAFAVIGVAEFGAAVLAALSAYFLYTRKGA